MHRDTGIWDLQYSGIQSFSKGDGVVTGTLFEATRRVGLGYENYLIMASNDTEAGEYALGNIKIHIVSGDVWELPDTIKPALDMTALYDSPGKGFVTAGAASALPVYAAVTGEMGIASAALMGAMVPFGLGLIGFVPPLLALSYDRIDQLQKYVRGKTSAHSPNSFKLLEKASGIMEQLESQIYATPAAE